MYKLLKVGIGVGLVFLINGCVTFSTFHTADTVPAGDIHLGLGFNSGIIKQKSQIRDFSQEIKYFSIFPNFWNRMGIIENLDLGFGIGGAQYEADIKFRFLKENESLQPSLAIGGGVLYQDLLWGDTRSGNYFLSFYYSKHIFQKIGFSSAYRSQWSKTWFSPHDIDTEEYLEVRTNVITLGLFWDVSENKRIIMGYDFMWPEDNCGNTISNVGVGIVLAIENLF